MSSKPNTLTLLAGYTHAHDRAANKTLPVSLPAEGRPGQVFRLQPEIMYMIMAKLDIFTARVWGLTCWQFNEEYKKNCENYARAAELLQDAGQPHLHLSKVLPLSARCHLPDGTFTTLIRCISATLPPHLSWNPFTGRLADATALHATVCEINDYVDRAKQRKREEEIAAEEQEKERKAAKRQRRINIANKMESKRQLCMAEAEENGTVFDPDEVSVEDFSDGPISDSDEDMDGDTDEDIDEDMEYY